LTNNEIKGGIYDAFVDCMQNGNDFKSDPERSTALNDFETAIRSLCRALRLMLDKAESRARRDRLHKNVRLAIERYEKAHRNVATKADVERCLKRIGDECTGSDVHARQARDNASDLQQTLDEKVHNAGELVDADAWIKRLRLLWECPWKKLQVE
jgi:phage baseplate assembly protein W